MKALVRSLYLTGSLWIFALFIQSEFPLRGFAVLGLVLSAYWISNMLRRNPEIYLQKSLWQWRQSMWPITLVSLVLAVLVSMQYRLSIHLPLIPTRTGGFVLISILIGCCEELIFRGVVQGEAGLWHKEGAIVLGAMSHAGYKSLLFVLSAQLIDIPVYNLFGMTFLAGIVLGFTRYKSGSLWPCVLAHGLFDLWVYMELTTAPWWVW